MLPYREAQLLHKIASKTPPISAEDAAAVGGAGDVDKVLAPEFSHGCIVVAFKMCIL
jgi:hypothetical protein